jgi:hypothetical protein
VVRYEGAYRLCYIRGPEGLLIHPQWSDSRSRGRRGCLPACERATGGSTGGRASGRGGRRGSRVE